MQSVLSGYFTCPKGHDLTWQKSYIADCGRCGKVASNQMSRFKCNECNISFCVKCIVPPVTGDYCGGGHPMTYVEKLSYHSCDVCRASIQGGAYRCGTCDYDVCLKCYIEKED